MELRTKTPRVGSRRSYRLRDSFLEDLEYHQNQMTGDASDGDSPTPQVEEEMSEDSPLQQEATQGLKDCTVTLRRLLPDDEEKYDMSRKSGKQPVSRIPTFQSTLAKKRPTGSIEPTTPSLAKKEATSQVGQPTEKASSSVDASRSKPNIRETALPLLLVRLPKYNAEALAQASSPEQTITSGDVSTPTLPTNQLMEEASEELNPMTVDPRPALRAEPVDHATDPLQSDGAQDTVYDSTNGRSFTLAAQKGTDEDSEAQVKMGDDCLSSRAEKMEPFEMVEAGEAGETDLNLAKNVGVCDEKTLCEDESTHIESVLEEHSCDSTCLEEPAIIPEMVNGNQLQSDNQGNVSASHPTVLKEPQRTSKYRKPNKTSSCCWSVALFCLFPSALLLVGGFGQHVWHYGIPSSVSHLMAQLELHWLEGFGMLQEACSSDCRVNLVESIPQGLYPSGSPTPLPSISDTWISLLDQANHSVDIAAFYFSLRDTDLGIAEPSALQGKEVFNRLVQLQSKGVKLQIAVNSPQSSTEDTAKLATTGAEVREVDLQSVTGGIVHTKLWVVDQKHLYLGSANMDWRSLTQVKEVGVAVENCSCLAQDVSRIFGVYWNIGAQKNGSLPPYWPARYSALSSAERPLTLRLNGVPAQVYVSSAPPQISARGRSDDLSSILSVISDAQEFVYISVMDYLPLSQFTKPLRFWPAIDSAIRAAACTRGVEVNMLVSCWLHSPGSMFIFLQSLAVLNTPPLGCNINVKVFEVPSTTEEKKIPFARVNHAKYMVTDRVVYIGTSNWSENYFTQTAGVGLVVNQTGSVIGKGERTLQSQLQEVFQRDWTSEYARNLSNDDAEHCGRHRH